MYGRLGESEHRCMTHVCLIYMYKKYPFSFFLLKITFQQHLYVCEYLKIDMTEKRRETALDQ